MPCENPRRIKNRRYVKLGNLATSEYSVEKFGTPTPPDLYIDVPCGYCFSCQKRRMNEYRVRLMNEIQKWPYSIFVTLTFDDRNLARFKDSPNDSLRLFFDRLRKKYGKSYRHWFIGEYGTLNGRLHYHGFIFDTPRYGLPYHELTKLWSYGNLWLGYCTAETVNYIVKYTTKYSNNGTRPPRVFSSKGIGDNYLNPRQILFHKNGLPLSPFMNINGVTYPLPRYYYNKIFDDDDKVYLRIAMDSVPFFLRYVDGKPYTDERSYRIALDNLYRKNVFLGLSYSSDPYKKSLESVDPLATIFDPLTGLTFDPYLNNEFTCDIYPF